MTFVKLSTGETVEVGTWLDGRFGWHNLYRVVRIAEHHGFSVPEECREMYEEYGKADYQPDDDDDVMGGHGGLADQATDFLNSLLPEADDSGTFWSFEWDMGEFSLAKLNQDGNPVEL